MSPYGVLPEAREALERDVTLLLLKRINRLRDRKFVLFRWLRLKWLMRKYAKAQKFLHGAIALFLLVGCSSVQINDHEWCVIAGSDGAYCFHTLTEQERDLTEAEWKLESRGWLAGSPEAYANLKEAIEKLCSETKKCTYEEQQNLKKFFTKVEEAQEKAKPPTNGFEF